MFINVRDILVEGVGYNQSFKIAGERPELESLRLAQPIEGEITVSRLDSGLLVSGTASTTVELECHRCLSTFNRPVRIRFDQLYALDPGDDELPIQSGTIDLAPLMEQEITLSLPIKILCKPDCPGITAGQEDYNKVNPSARLKDTARITKGTKRGRT